MLNQAVVLISLLVCSFEKLFIVSAVTFYCGRIGQATVHILYHILRVVLRACPSRGRPSALGRRVNCSRWGRALQTAQKFTTLISFSFVVRSVGLLIYAYFASEQMLGLLKTNSQKYW